MRDSEIVMNPNELVRYLKKPADEFTRHDIVRLDGDNGVIRELVINYIHCM